MGGGPGDDHLDGGPGSDEATFPGASAGVEAERANLLEGLDGADISTGGTATTACTWGPGTTPCGGDEDDDFLDGGDGTDTPTAALASMSA